MAERQRAMGAECHPVSSPAGVAQHVVCCLLGQGQLAPQVYEEMSPSSLQSQLGSMGELTAFPKQPSSAPAPFPPLLYLPSTQSISTWDVYSGPGAHHVLRTLLNSFSCGKACFIKNYCDISSQLKGKPHKGL